MFPVNVQSDWALLPILLEESGRTPREVLVRGEVIEGLTVVLAAPVKPYQV